MNGMSTVKRIFPRQFDKYLRNCRGWKRSEEYSFGSRGGFGIETPRSPRDWGLITKNTKNTESTKEEKNG
jgi:hypothetical protein